MSEAVKHLVEYEVDKRYQATVISSERITSEQSDEEVREIVLDVDREDFPFRLGQSIGVYAPAPPDFGQEYHFRLYSVADLPEQGESRKPRIKIAVKRCFFIDEYSGEEYPGIASNYLCDLRSGDTVTMSGPFGLAFEIPEERDANLILIGTGTGIAPFRALVKHLYHNVPDWTGRVWLFYGAKSGLELFYMNDRRDDFAQYYDHDTFEAFKALSPRPTWAEPIDWKGAIAARAQELWKMMGESKTYVFVAGLQKMRDELDVVFSNLASSKQAWQRRRAELVAGGRWVELLY